MELGLWRLDDSGPQRISASQMPSEEALEGLIAADSTVLGSPLLIIGRQLRTPYGGVIDLVGLDGDGVLHILELKRDKTPRDVVAQTLDYASWAAGLGHSDLTDIYASYASRIKAEHDSLEAAFSDAFDLSLPDELNTEHRMTIVAGTSDASTERIVRYLAEQYGVALNVVFFRYFEDSGRRYVARTWLLDDQTVADDARPARSRAASKRESWNGRDYYAVFGPGEGSRAWPDARTYGFFGAGGGKRYTQPIRNLQPGQRLWIYVTGHGYVGTGTVAGPAVEMSEATVESNGETVRLLDQPLVGRYEYASESGDHAEWVVPMTWDRTVALEDAVYQTGMFASVHIVCKLANSFTLDELARSPLGLEQDA